MRVLLSRRIVGGTEIVVEEVTSVVATSKDYGTPYMYRLSLSCLNGDVLDICTYFTPDLAKKYLRELNEKGYLDLTRFKFIRSGS